MPHRQHRYRVHLQWTGNQDAPAASFRNHKRAYEITSGSKPPIAGSSDPVFRGDGNRWNPEDLLVAALSACHKLWYMGLCAQAGITVLAYEDDAEGIMQEEQAGGAGQFSEVILRPRVSVAAGADLQAAHSLHVTAHAKCFIARSVNFTVSHQAVITVADSTAGAK